jgi:transitional endoplasmic reticulum ATPase
MDYTKAMRENGLPLRRTVLLHGPYGTGKTLAAYLTAQKAVENGWTFIFVRPGKDSLNDALATARLYQPAVLFFEDIDTTSDPEWDVSKLLDLFDGLQSKGTDIVGIFTTNHAEKIHKGLVRPGRLDAIIEINQLDTDGIWKLIHALVPPENLADDLDKEAIGEAMTEFQPAFVKECIDRAQRYAIARNGGVPQVLTTADFVDAAKGLDDHLKLMNGAKEAPERDALTTAVTRVIDKVLTDKVLVAPQTQTAVPVASIFVDRDEVPDFLENQLPKEKV